MDKIYRNQKCHVYLYFICLILLPLSLLSQIPKSSKFSLTNIDDKSEGSKLEHNSRHQIDDHIFYEHIPRHPARDKYRSEIHNPQYANQNQESKTNEKFKTNSEIDKDKEKDIKTISSKEDNTDFNSVENDYIQTSAETTKYPPPDSNRRLWDEEVYEYFHEGMPGMENQVDVDELRETDFNQKETNEAGMPGRSSNEILHPDGGFVGSRPELINSNRNGPQGRRPGGMHNGFGTGKSGPKHNQGMNINNQTPTDQTNSSYAFGLLSTLFNSAYEILMFVFIGGFIYNCFFGKTHNDKYYQIWYNANKEYFEKRYETVGYKSMVKKEDEDDIRPTGVNMIKENPYVFKLVCYKYRYIKALLVLLEFHKRQDAISMVTSLLVNTKDRLIYQVVIDPIEDVCWMFCVCKKRDAKILRKSYADINFFGKDHDPSIFNEKLTVLTENLELFVELFQNKNLLSFYKSIENYIDMIYYTDQETVCKDKHAIFFSFELHLNKTSGQENILLEITHFVNLFADTLAQLRVNENLKKEFEMNRVSYERSKMEDVKRKEIEEIEKRDFIEQWKEKNKNKYKKIGQKKNKEKNK